MPRKRKAWSTKEIQKAAKEQELLFIRAWVNFFNQDPIEYFSDYHALKGEFAKIAHDPKAQETLRQSFTKVADTIKAVITAYEDFWQGRAPKDGLKRLKEAVEALNELIELRVVYKLGVSNAGVVRDNPVVHESRSKIDFVSSLFFLPIANHVANFKDWISHYQEHLPIGVCRYEKCQKFFVKERKDERYCSPQHKNADWVKKYRVATGKYRSWRRK